MDETFFDRMRDIGVFQFCKKHDLAIGEVDQNRIRSYLEIVSEFPIIGLTREQEKEIILGYIQGLGVDLYWRVQYSAELMRLLRHCLENDVPITKLMHRASFDNNDIKEITIVKSTYEIRRIMKKREEMKV